MATRAEISRYDDLWYNAEKGKETARAITRSAVRREIANIPMRARNWTYYREMTGRPTPTAFAYGMAKRPANFTRYYSSLQFSGMKSGFASTMCDVYTNRLLAHQTFVSMIPVKGDAEQNATAQEIEEGIELADDQMKYFAERAVMGTEGFWYGRGWMYFGDDGQNNPKLQSVMLDELLFANIDDTDPYDVIWRRWCKKSELLEEKGIKGNKAAEQAILDAPTAYPAFFFGAEPDCTDIVPLLCGWTRPISKSVPGRYVRVVGDFCLNDEKWEYPLPFEGWDYEVLPGSLVGKGIAEKVLQVSQWIDGLLTRGVAADMRNGSGKWFIDENANVNPDALGDLDAAICLYMNKIPQWVTPEPVGQYWLDRLKFLFDLGRSIVHVSEAASKGEIPAGITAAIAIEKYAQIDDQNFLEKIGRLEDFDKRAAYQKIMLFKRLNAKFTSGAKTLDWGKIKLNKSFRINDLEAYNVGRLSQTVAGRIQILEQMRGANRIDDKAYNKFLQTPDIPGMFQDLNAETNDIQKMLDQLVKADDYIPPTPYLDPKYAKKLVEIRYAREEFDGLVDGVQTNQAALDRLSMWRSTVMSFINQAATPDAPPSVAAGATPEAAGIAPPADAFGAPGLPPIDPNAPPPPVAPLPPPPALPLLQTSATPG
jgi:hypothetical protein